MGWLSDLWFVCDRTVQFWYKGPVQTSNFSCAEPNYQIRLMKSSTYESIRFVDSFVFGSTRQSNGAAKVGHRFRRRTSSRAESNLHTSFSNLSTAFMIGCIVSCDTWRELTEAWWPFRSRMKHVGTGPPAQNGRLPTCINAIYIFIPYLYLNIIAISLNINGTQQKKLLRLGVYKCSNPGAKTNYWNETEWK